MIIYDLTVIYPYRPLQKHWIPAAISAAASIASTILSNKMSKDNARDAYNAQKDYSQWLLRNQTQESVKDLRAAGLNPAFMNGAQLANTPDQPQYDVPNVQSPIDFGSAMMFAQVAAQTENLQVSSEKARQDAQLVHEQAEALKIENARKRVEDKNTAEYLQSQQDYSNIEEWLTLHPNELPETVAINVAGASGALSAKQRIKEYERAVQDVSINDVRNNLEKMITDGQIHDTKVMRALVQMPYQEYRNLMNVTNNVIRDTLNKVKQGELLDIEKMQAQLDYEITQDSNINQYIDKLFDGDFSMKDLTKVLVMAILGGFGKLNFAPIGSRKTSSNNVGSVTSNSTVSSRSNSTVHVYPHRP